MGAKVRCTALAALVFCPPLAQPDLAAAAVKVHAAFSPNRLGESTSFSMAATFDSPASGPRPTVTHVTVYGPSGLSIDTRGAGTCTASPLRLEELGPGACPADSRVGFGSGVSQGEIAGQFLDVDYALDFFLALPQHGSLTMLAYVSSATPVQSSIVSIVHSVQGRKPYGPGFSLDVMDPPSLPGLSPSWEKRVSVSFGANHIAYYRAGHGSKKLVHVKGIVLPRRCPRGGFPVEASFVFADGSTAISKHRLPCPRR